METSELDFFWVKDPLSGGKVKVVRRSSFSNRGRLLRRGKVRDIYISDGHLYIFSSDRVSSFDVVLPTLIPHKGESLHGLSVWWFERSRRIFPNHLVESIDNRTMKVLRAERLDIEWVVRGYLYGSLWREYKSGKRRFGDVTLPNGLQLAEELPEPMLHPTTKSDVGHDLPITRKEAIDKKLVSPEEWAQLEEAAISLYEFYRREAASRGIIIADTKMEFGRYDGTLIQIDEPPTHDSSRLWSKSRYQIGVRQEASCLDKEFLREYLRRVGFSGEGEPPTLPDPIVAEVSKRCVGAYKVISGSARMEDFQLKTVNEVMEELEIE